MNSVMASQKHVLWPLLGLALICLMLSGGVLRAETVQANYRFYWGGIRVGKINLTINEDERQYRINSTAKTTGLVRVLSEHESHAFARGVKREGRYIPIHFRSEYTSGGKEKLIELRYDSKGIVQSEKLKPKRKESRPEVPKELKGAGVLDIFTTLFAMRDQLKQALKEKKTTFIAPIYDGKRRFNLHATIADVEASFEAQDHKQPAIAVELLREPLAGYTKKERRKLKETNPVTKFYVRKSDFLPLGLTVDIRGATLRAELQ